MVAEIIGPIADCSTATVRMALETLRANKLRSFLTLLGVIFGVATVIVVVSLIEGFNKYVDEKITSSIVRDE